MVAYKTPRRNILSLLLILPAIGLIVWGTWRNRQPTLQIHLAPKEVRSFLANPNQNRYYSHPEYERYRVWQQFISRAPRPEFTHDGKFVLVAVGLELKLYEVETGRLVRNWKVPPLTQENSGWPRGSFPASGIPGSLSLRRDQKEDLWYIWHNSVSTVGIYRLRPDAPALLPPFKGIARIRMISPDGRFVVGDFRNKSFVWERDTGTLRPMQHTPDHDEWPFYSALRTDPVTGLWYGLTVESRTANGKKDLISRLVFVDPKTEKERPRPDFLQDPSIVVCYLTSTEIITGHRDGTLQVRSRQSPKLILQTVASGMDIIHWVAANSVTLQAGGYKRMTPGLPGRFMTVIRDRQGQGRDKTFETPDFRAVDSQKTGNHLSESVTRWGKTRLYVLERSWYKNRTNTRQEAWIGDTTTGRQVRIPWEVSASEISLSPREDSVAWIDRVGTLNLWRVPL